jgi:leucyl/phenylalanyl-tRNA--protein transferase
VHAPASSSLIAPELLMLAYRTGVFPMADTREDTEIFWVEPRQRAILPLDGFHLSRSLAKVLRQGRFTVTCNAAFADVVEACAAPRRNETDGEETWISHRIAASYENLHRLGMAHSIECWRDGALVGGLYGVAFDKVFCGESMFSRERDASKVALAWLVAAMRRRNMALLDCQFLTDHLSSLGAIQVSQARYVEMLKAAQEPYSAAGLADALAVGVGAGVALGEGDGVAAGFAALLGDAEGAGLGSSPGKFIAQCLTQTS